MYHQTKNKTKSWPQIPGKISLTQCFDGLSPIVSIQNNFDVLNVPKDHISRNKSDSYYINQSQLLRTHTSAHQRDHLVSNIDNFVVFGKIFVIQVMFIEEIKSIDITILFSIKWKQ